MTNLYVKNKGIQLGNRWRSGYLKRGNIYTWTNSLNAATERVAVAVCGNRTTHIEGVYDNEIIINNDGIGTVPF